MPKQKSFCDYVVDHVNQAASLISLDQDIRQILSQTINEVIINFPVKTENGKVEMFTGYRVQHNNVMGPFEGGIRFHPTLGIEEVRVLANCTTWKAAIANIPFGGASGGIQFDPTRYTFNDLERITRRFTFALGNNIGPEYDILAPDVGTNSQIMAWILDTYLSTMPPHKRQACKHVVTGKPIKSGGSQGRDKATGQGIAFLVQKWAEEKNFNLKGATYIVQGFGNVGSWTARLLKPLGVRLIAVEDFTGAIFNPEGIDPDDLCEYVKKNRKIAGYAQAKSVDHKTFLQTRADIFVPAALENQINSETAPLLNVKLVAEGANGPTDPEGDQILQKKGIDLIPDILCNSGGLIVSYFEWLQNKRSEFWELEEVDSKLHTKIISAYNLVIDKSKELKADLRTAAYASALSRLERVYKRRGIFP
ncbi:MAG: Glu/Leu/Phe/Val dehydrogenase [candidate division Zixibacteria bacterium]|nr:Glu/Leu/Phe/Val dehydrogenase [candidate division Zixibacteria bacterium]